jgi:ribonuclease HI
MWITIIADASYCPNTGATGYAFWIASQRGKRGGAGIPACAVVNNNAAEIIALLAALNDACKVGLVREGDFVLLQTDCQAAIKALKGVRLHITKQETSLVSWFNNFVSEHKLHIQIRHVQGHTGRKDSRFVANNICDEKARRNMRLARERHKKQLAFR